MTVVLCFGSMTTDGGNKFTLIKAKNNYYDFGAEYLTELELDLPVERLFALWTDIEESVNTSDYNKVRLYMLLKLIIFGPMMTR